MSKTISIRMERDNYEFLHEITNEERSDLSRGMAHRGQNVTPMGRSRMAPGTSKGLTFIAVASVSN